MELGYIIGLAIGIPLILFPAAIVWFLNVSGILTVWKESKAREKKRAQAKAQAR